MSLNSSIDFYTANRFHFKVFFRFVLFRDVSTAAAIKMVTRESSQYIT